MQWPCGFDKGAILQHSCRCNMMWLNNMAVTASAILVCNGCWQHDQFTKVKLYALHVPAWTTPWHLRGLDNAC